MTLLLVRWRDAWFEYDNPEGERFEYVVATVGFVVREDDRFLSIAQELLPDGDGFRATTHIPIAVIESREVLKEE